VCIELFRVKLRQRGEKPGFVVQRAGLCSQSARFCPEPTVNDGVLTGACFCIEACVHNMVTNQIQLLPGPSGANQWGAGRGPSGAGKSQVRLGTLLVAIAVLGVCYSPLLYDSIHRRPAATKAPGADAFEAASNVERGLS